MVSHGCFYETDSKPQLLVLLLFRDRTQKLLAWCLESYIMIVCKFILWRTRKLCYTKSQIQINLDFIQIKFALFMQECWVLHSQHSKHVTTTSKRPYFIVSAGHECIYTALSTVGSHIHFLCFPILNNKSLWEALKLLTCCPPICLYHWLPKTFGKCSWRKQIPTLQH